MTEVSIQEYILRQMQMMLSGKIVVESAYENYSWPTDEQGPVHTSAAGRFEFYICARLPTTPDGLTPAPQLPLESLLRQHMPDLFRNDQKEQNRTNCESSQKRTKMPMEEKLNALEQRIARLERLIAAYGINEETAIEYEYKPLKVRKSDPDEMYEPLTRPNGGRHDAQPSRTL